MTIDDGNCTLNTLAYDLVNWTVSSITGGSRVTMNFLHPYLAFNLIVKTMRRDQRMF